MKRKTLVCICAILIFIGALGLFGYKIFVYDIKEAIEESREKEKQEEEEKKQYPVNSKENCLGNICYKLYDKYYINESDYDFVVIKYEDEKTYCYYHLEVEKSKYNNETEYFEYLKNKDIIKFDKIEDKVINGRNYKFVDYSSDEKYKDYEYATIENGFLYSFNVHLGAKNKDYNNCLTAYDYIINNLTFEEIK